MAYKYPICDIFHWFCKMTRFFATEPYPENSKLKIKLLSKNTGVKNPGGNFSIKEEKL
jgi:hypothetical protein